MTKDEALKLALEALEEAWYHVGTFQPTEKAIDLYDEARTAIKEALAQPEQDWIERERAVGYREGHQNALKQMAQPEQAPMNYYRADAKGNLERTDIYFAQPEQEPLEYWNAVEGWVKIDEVREHFDSVGCGTIYKTAGEGREPLYTTPPQRSFDYKEHAEGLQRDYDLLLAEYNDLKAQRTWVGLTDEEIEQMGLSNYIKVVRETEAKLKEKNT